MFENLVLLGVDYLVAVLIVYDSVTEADMLLLIYEILKNELDPMVPFQEEVLLETIMQVKLAVVELVWVAAVEMLLRMAQQMAAMAPAEEAEPLEMVVDKQVEKVEMDMLFCLDSEVKRWQLS